jgi:hypothetical protein
MTAIQSNRKTEKRKTQDMTQRRKHKWHFQEAWMHVEKIKEHLDSMTQADVPASGEQAGVSDRTASA